MRGVKARVKALVVPVLVVTVWSLPGDRVDVEVAGATEASTVTVTTNPSNISAEPSSSIFEPLADAAPTTNAVVTSTTTRVPGVNESTERTPSPTTTVPIEPATTLQLETTTTAILPTTTTSSLAEQALNRVSYDWRTAFPDWRVEFHGARDGIRALTYPAERRVEIFIRPSDTAATLHRVFAHELGHVVDVEMNSDGDRARWLEQREIAQETTWWPSAQSPDFATGAGDFAEAFAVWETGVSTRSTIGDQPESADLDLLRELAQG